MTRAPAFKSSANNVKWVKTAPDDEVIEDSEPEREEQRKIEKERRKERRGLRGLKQQSKHIEIIEVSDDSLDAPQIKLPIRAEQGSVIVISDDSDEPPLPERRARHVVKTSVTGQDPDLSETSAFDHSSTLPDIRDILGLSPKHVAPSSEVNDYPEPRPRAESPPRTQTTAGVSTQSPKPTRIHASKNPETDSEEEQPRPFSLARFACVRASRTPSRTGFTSRSVSTSSVASRLPSREPSVIDIPPPRAASMAQAGPSDPKPSGKRGRRALPPSRAFASISDRDMARILSCVGCNLAWTTRKTAAQKMKHIETCTRKAGLTDETVEVLLKQELAKAPVEPAKAKGKGKATEPEPKTLLGEKIGDEGTKRKRRSPVEGTVRELGDTREDILKRARQLLNDTTRPQTSSNNSDHNVRASADDEEEYARPPLTQPFGKSALAQRFRPAQSLLSQAATQMRPPTSVPSRDIQEPVDSPPRTQSFGESALVQRFGTNPLAFDDDGGQPLYSPGEQADIDPSWLENPELDYDDGVLRYTPDPALPKEKSVPLLDTTIMDTSSSAPGLLSRSSNLSKGRNVAFDHQEATESSPLRSPSRPVAGQSAEAEHVPMDQDSPDANDAILHYDPGSALGFVSPPSQAEDSDVLLQSVTKKTIKRGRKPKSRAETETAPADTQSHPSATTQKSPSSKSKPRSKAKDKKKGTVLTEEDVHHRLRDRILSDTQLYLRILRYEPLPLDLFVQLLCVDEEVKVTGALKAQVRSFLDKQAIQFYDHEPGTRGRRRRR
ncbi:hypothetical protein EIP86_001816 [Pleurotus ostreatoroseus]|nr:hypothetical protein EIP86_001816 [Pleurotus ostreatoroseus]